LTGSLDADAERGGRALRFAPAGRLATLDKRGLRRRSIEAAVDKVLGDNPDSRHVQGRQDQHRWLPCRSGHEGHGREGQPEGRSELLAKKLS